jgi:hypothetical protein
MRWLKLFLALLLLPATVAVTGTVWELGRHLIFDGEGYRAISAWAFGGGYALWLVIFVLLPKPTRTYVLGHELTHAFWALLMGARVSGLKVSKSGGEVVTSKTNWFITLAPYFLPFYAMLFIGLFYLVHAFWSLTDQLWVLFFLVGLGWSFHMTFTLMILFSVGQPDVRSQGVLFSVVTIYLMNLLVIAVTATCLSPALHFRELAVGLGQNLAATYGWTLDKAVWLWQDAARRVRQTS